MRTLTAMMVGILTAPAVVGQNTAESLIPVEALSATRSEQPIVYADPTLSSPVSKTAPNLDQKVFDQMLKKKKPTPQTVDDFGMFADAAKAHRDQIKNVVRKGYNQRQDLTIKPGYTKMIPVAVNYKNRITTNFQRLEVKTENKQVPIRVSGGELLITPQDNRPVSVILSEVGMPETSVGLTLVPIDVPPVFADVVVPLTAKQRATQTQLLAKEKELARQKEITSAPTYPLDPRKQSRHSLRIAQLLGEVATQVVPHGFRLEMEVPADLRYPCDALSLAMHHEVKQRLVSTREVIDVMLVTNDINGIRPIREELCLSDDVLAVASFERGNLAPGETAEVYILRNRLHQKQQAPRRRVRPSLVDTGA